MENNLPSSEQLEVEIAQLRNSVKKLEQSLQTCTQENAQLQQKLRETSEIKAAIDQHAIVAITDEKGIINYVNDKFCRLSQYSSQELIGQTCSKINAGFHAAPFFTDLWQTIEKGDVWRGQIKNKAKDGSFYWVDTTITPLINEAGKPYQYMAIQADITQQKEIEARLKESEAKHRLITENMSDLIGMHDTTGKFIYITSSIKAILGYEPEDLLGKTPFDFTHPDDLTFIISEYNKIVQERSSTYVQYKFRKKNGDYIWLETIAQTVTNDIEGEEIIQVHSASRDITARKEVEESLRLFQFCIENSSDSVFWIDQYAQLLYVNKAACQLLDYTKEELLQMHVADIDPLYQSDIWPDHWKELRDRGNMQFESMHKLRDGRIIPTEVSANYLHIRDKEYNFAFARDISERKASEQNLRFNNYILSLVRDAIVGMDSSNIIVYWNKAAELQYGITASEAIGKPLNECYKFEWINEEDEQRTAQSLARSGYCHVENIHTLKNGTRIYIESDVQQFNFPDSGLIGLFAVMRDITERKQAEADLLNYAQRSITILESITDSMLILNQDWQIVYLNKQAEVVLGMRREMILHKNIWEMYHTVVDTTFYQQFNKAFTENTDVHFEEYFEPLNKWFEVHAYPSSEGLSVYFRSIQERKVAEENLKETLEELKKRNYELDNYVYKVSHDLRAPLSSILGLIDLLKQEEDPDTIRHYISLIENRINKSDQFIHSVLSHSRILNSQVKVSEINFRKMISESYEELKYIANSEKLHIEINITGEDAFYTDEFRLDIIFKNFISNAIKYMNPYVDYSYLRFDVEVDEANAVIRIQDNGIGIEKSYMEKVFDMFFRATEKSDGSGLGLYIVKQTLDRIGGTIQVASEFGEGTTFTLVLKNTKSEMINE